ncbi:sensor domain-containing diguanylate cyclase/phosphohydrolase [[Clostridium] dakarense]|uniref:sensor domain-containing diguanylate cyclase/phosphohydrolase n=1 Tax=Faecalimicrobium dakarense TaxID=1301100 RepID=UPI0004B79F8E|nr:HD domain-containing phosphohydrolase [[Clostridium] dakarense]
MINEIARFALDNMPFTIWIKDLDKNFIFINKAFKNLYNLEVDDYKSIKKEVCDKCNVKSICDQKINDVLESGETSKFDVKVGDIENQCYISPYFDENNKLMGIFGVLVDITKVKSKQKQLEERENILRTIIDTLPNYIFYKDKDSRYVGYNKKWSDHYKKLGIDSMIGKNDFEVDSISDSLAFKYRKQDLEVMESKKMIREVRGITTQEGENRIEETIKVPVVNEDGEVWGIVALSTDVTETIELKEKLMKLSYTDSLTGVYNRACFEEKKEALNSSKHLPIGVIMGDVNGLKFVNDTFGHLEGDKLLKNMTNILRKVTCKNDFIFRWGGDEFIILMPNCDEDKCEQVIKNIIDGCKKVDFELIEMSISLGSSIKHSLEASIYDNLKEAEEKLYRQKFLQERSIRSSIIFSLNQSLNEKNVETEQHTKRLVDYACQIGKRLGFNTSQLDELALVTSLHDIGKIGISEEILLKPEKLTKEEYDIIKTHTEKGYRILQASGELSHVSKGVLAHHERYDGLGYPLGLSKEEIPITSRIVNIVDSYDAMISDRGYNTVKTKSEAIEEIKRCSGTQFDPNIAKIFIEILENEEG